MQPEELLQLIKQPKDITPSAVKALQEIAEQYPYFQLAFTLIAKAAYAQDPDKAQPFIQVAAIYATDRNCLKLFLEDKLIFKVQEEQATILEASNPQLATQPFNRQASKEADFINNYISTIRTRQEQKITKRKSLEQLNIIENFIQQGGHFKPKTIQSATLDATQVDLSQESSTLQDDLITESLAQVMIKQGKFQQALEIYHKLQLKFSEKKSYFSVLIEELKKEI
jgi:tetratricopeptide (TPR) repeat protein